MFHDLLQHRVSCYSPSQGFGVFPENWHKIYGFKQNPWWEIQALKPTRMKLDEFRSLNKIDQHIILWEQAVLIAERENQTYKYILYQLAGFYIEVRLSKVGFKEVVRTFSRDRRLDPYLQTISLRELGVMANS
jgi:hypothetical protein